MKKLNCDDKFVYILTQLKQFGGMLDQVDVLFNDSKLKEKKEEVDMSLNHDYKSLKTLNRALSRRITMNQITRDFEQPLRKKNKSSKSKFEWQTKIEIEQK